MSLEAVDDSLGGVLRALGLAEENRIDENESFVTLRCRDRENHPLVLKYLRDDSPDARRRIRNEALLTRSLPVGEPLRLLKYRAHGPRYLLTEFDPGVLLRPGAIGDETLVAKIADALVLFQSVAPEELSDEMVDREHLRTYYVKVMGKHLLHPFPSFVSARTAARALAILLACLPSVLRVRVLCHGDFLPTNLLYRPRDGTVTVTDLEGSMTGNHPLFDVLALFTTDERPLEEWSWQGVFLKRYLAGSAPIHGLDPSSADFRRAYRGILTFFLVYRLNESRLHLESTAYFDGDSKGAYLKKRVLRLPRDLVRGRSPSLPALLEVRRRNLSSILSTSAFRAHFDSMVGERSASR